MLCLSMGLIGQTLKLSNLANKPIDKLCILRYDTLALEQLHTEVSNAPGPGKPVKRSCTVRFGGVHTRPETTDVTAARRDGRVEADQPTTTTRPKLSKGARREPLRTLQASDGNRFSQSG